MSKDKTAYNKRQLEYYYKYRNMILEYYGGLCSNCGITDVRLCIDHVYNDGRKDRYGKPKGYTGAGYHKKIWQQIEMGCATHYQLLCYKCHAQKHLCRVV